MSNRRFTCPKCGSDEFGTSNCTASVEFMVGHCHGDIGCKFSWPRKDDHLYFSVDLPTLYVVFGADSQYLYSSTEAEACREYMTQNNIPSLTNNETPALVEYIPSDCRES